MSRMKTQSGLWIALLAAVFAALTSAARAMDLPREFANCTGRYSALMEHHWLMSDPGSDRSEARRASFIALLDAVTPADGGRQVLAWRIEAKAAQAALLSTASFGTDPRRRQDAARLAAARIAACDRLLLGS